MRSYNPQAQYAYYLSLELCKSRANGLPFQIIDLMYPLRIAVPNNIHNETIIIHNPSIDSLQIYSYKMHNHPQSTKRKNQYWMVGSSILRRL